jgi:hypothetical protein
MRVTWAKSLLALAHPPALAQQSRQIPDHLKVMSGALAGTPVSCMNWIKTTVTA